MVFEQIDKCLRGIESDFMPMMLFAAVLMRGTEGFVFGESPCFPTLCSV